MAFNRAPSPVLRVDGTIRKVEVYKTGDTSAFGAGRDAARVMVLTDGGFIEVYVDPDSYLTTVCQLGEGSSVSWAVEVDVFHQTAKNGNRYGSLSARLVRDLDAAAGSHLHAAQG